MTQLEIKNLIKTRKIEIINEFGDQGDEQNDEILLNWLTQEFFFGEITRQELDAFAAEMGYEIKIGFGDDEEITNERNLEA